MSWSSTKSGQAGEELACALLCEKGFEIIERNYRFGKTGEIDIIARDGETLVFVEVKYRQSLEYGQPEDGITKSKIKQVRRLAESYLFEKNIDNVDCRFDVVAILQMGKNKPLINHYSDAF